MAAAASSQQSRLKSPVATEKGRAPAANVAVEIAVAGVYDFIGGDQWLRYADTPTLPPPSLATTTSCRPSMSRSPVAADQALLPPL